jgi:predicted nucleic-acid-binding Zn-ribbon protein
MIFLKRSLPQCIKCSLHGKFIRDVAFLSKVFDIKRNIQLLVCRET